jgi:hypothetical protein
MTPAKRSDRLIDHDERTTRTDSSNLETRASLMYSTFGRRCRRLSGEWTYRDRMKNDHAWSSAARGGLGVPERVE